MIDSIAPILPNIVGLIAAMLILWRAEPAINRMDASTHWMIRYSMLLLAAGALALSVTIMAGTTPGYDTLFLALGIAMLLLCERRMRFLIHPKKGERRA